MIGDDAQYLRKITLLVVEGDKALDLSDFHIRFRTVQEDQEGPSNCDIRVYNLSEETTAAIRNEYSRVVLQAGYETGPFGVIFDGTIRQFRKGRENNTNTYLDILAADGDLAYNWAMLKKSIAAGASYKDRIDAIIAGMKAQGLDQGQIVYPDTGGILPRGKVLFGYAKAAMRQVVDTMGSTWSIQGGKVQVIPMDGYLPGEAVTLNSQTGLIGRAEQTQNGIEARCLLNPAINVGGSVQINQASINQTLSVDPNAPPGPAYNQYAGVQMLASVTADGLYRVYVAEHTGNTRGMEWYTDITCLTINPVTKKVRPYG